MGIGKESKSTLFQAKILRIELMLPPDVQHSIIPKNQHLGGINK
jgi:hypothetical protein